MAIEMAIGTVILGVIANAVTHLFGKGYEIFSSAVQRDRKVIEFVDTIVKDFSIQNRDDIENIEKFIRSPEVENLITKIISTEVIGKNKESNIDAIKQEFHILFQLHVNKKDLEEISNPLFDALLTVCIEGYGEQIKKGSIYAHDRVEKIRYEYIKNSLDSLEKDIEFLRNKDAPTVRNYLDFERKFKQTSAMKYESFRPPHLENAEQIPLEELYVTPNFTSSLDYKGTEVEVVTYDNLISNIYRSVILGDPGAGKTTLANKLCYDFSRDNNKMKFSGKEVIPILITLRDYGLKLESDNFSIIQYIEYVSNALYQEQPPSGAFEYLLRNGRIFLIFDGLDELLDTSKRQAISDNLELFGRLYPSVPIIITSRKVGYEQAPLSKERFSIFYISDFNDQQVEEYVNKWFVRNEDTFHEERTKFVTTFLNDSLHVKDLRSNPLILSLMCDLYRGEGYIPKNRPDVYEKCSELLLKKWDKIRGVSEGLVHVSHLKPTLGYIAFKIYSNDQLSGGVSKRKLNEIAVEFLFPRYYDIEDEAIEYAERFIDFSKGRAWVFSEIGTQVGGDDLYQFTHRTFLEYFTAYHLVRNCRTPEILFDFLLPRIMKREWDVVAQLTLQMQNLNIEGAGNEILQLILDKANEEHLKIKFNLISFSVRSLEFIVPSPLIINKIIISCLDLCIELNDKSKEDDSFTTDDVTINELINPLLVADKENISPIRKSLIVDINKKINEDDEIARAIFKILCSLPSFNFYFKHKGKEHLSTKINLLNLQHEIIEQNEKRVMKLCKTYKESAIDGFIIKICSIEDLIKYHGAGILFSVSAVYGTYPILAFSILDHFFYSCSQKIIAERKSVPTILHEIRKLSKLLCHDPIPWKYSTSSIGYSLISPFFDELIILTQDHDLDRDTFFSLFTLIGPLIENDCNLCHEDGVNKISEIDSILLEPIFFIFRAREYGYNISEVDDLIAHIGFTDKQANIIKKWIKKEILFLQLDTKDNFDKLGYCHGKEIHPY